MAWPAFWRFKKHVDRHNTRMHPAKSPNRNELRLVDRSFSKPATTRDSLHDI